MARKRALSAATFRRGINLWPPFLFAGIRVLSVGADYRSARVRLRLRRSNRNWVGTHFGGSLFAMTDPFWMLLVMQNLGPDYYVWDSAAEIRFVSPGRGDVFADFELTDDRLAEIRALTADGDKALVWFDTDVLASDGTLVATVRKQVYVRPKPQHEPQRRPAATAA
jgi:acyl-coenzyme A thioesterase PaaI-like protein